MADSPAGSPRTESFSPRSKLSTSVFPPPENSTGVNGRESEFLDMGEEESEEESDGEEAGVSAAGTGNLCMYYIPVSTFLT